MAKRNLSKKPKRKQLSRKLKRKTLNRKKGGRSTAKTSYPGDKFITRNSAEADESLRNICIGLLLFVVFILLPAANIAFSNRGGGETFQLPDKLESCLIDKNGFDEFLQKVEINDNMLTIKYLTNEEITKLKEDDLLIQYIQGDNINLPLTQEVIKSFIDKIDKLPRDNSVVDVDCIKKFSALFT